MALGSMFSVCLEDDLLTKINRAADRLDRSKNWVITAILGKFFDEKSNPEDLVAYVVAKKRAG